MKLEPRLFVFVALLSLNLTSNAFAQSQSPDLDSAVEALARASQEASRPVPMAKSDVDQVVAGLLATKNEYLESFKIAEAKVEQEITTLPNDQAKQIVRELYLGQLSRAWLIPRSRRDIRERKPQNHILDGLIERVMNNGGTQEEYVSLARVIRAIQMQKPRALKELRLIPSQTLYIPYGFFSPTVDAASCGPDTDLIRNRLQAGRGLRYYGRDSRYTNRDIRNYAESISLPVNRKTTDFMESLKVVCHRDGWSPFDGEQSAKYDPATHTLLLSQDITHESSCSSPSLIPSPIVCQDTSGYSSPQTIARVLREALGHLVQVDPTL